VDPFLKVVLAACEDLGTPRALTVSLLLRGEEWSQLSQLATRPLDYCDSESYWRDTVITDLLRKCDLPSGIDKEAVARATFLSCEAKNARTNVRLSRFVDETLFIEDHVDEAVYRFIGDWRKEVRRILGNLPDNLVPRFSTGATYADVGELTTIPDKMSSRPTIYSHSRDTILPFWGSTSWGRSVVEERRDSDPQTVRGNIFFTVPKDGKTFRGCCKESSLNVSFQLDIGRVIRGRLKRIGIDLQHGQDHHRSKAREGSLDNGCATIDMSNASDTMCRLLPKLVLPAEWHELLASLRARLTRFEGQKWFRLEKFSSMGNGFTFELETLLFSTLARTVIACEGGDPDQVMCYGDDLIVPSCHYLAVTAALRLFGFEPNMKKTFAEGPFRESCGGDYWAGAPVRGHFVRAFPNEPQEWISLANGLRRTCIGNKTRWQSMKRAWRRCLDQLPRDIRRCVGPEFLGDIVIHDDPEFWQFARPPRGHDPSWFQQYVFAYVPVPVVLPWNNWKASVQLASCTLGPPSDGITPRGGVSGYRVRRVGALLAGPASSWTPSVTVR
jgi:hypothetical protein